MQCKYLKPLDLAIQRDGHRETYRGQPWSRNCREWVYYDVVLDLNVLREAYSLPEVVVSHLNTDEKSGLESGFVCGRCHDGVMGLLKGPDRYPPGID